MVISFVGGGEASAANGGDPSITLPAMQQNDLVVVVGSIGDSDLTDQDLTMTSPGYTEAPGVDLFSDDANDTQMAVFYKFMPATPDTTAVFNGLGGNNAGCAAVCIVFRGVNTTTPLDVTPTTATGINTFNPDPPSIGGFTDPDVWTVMCLANGHAANAQSYTFPAAYATNARDLTGNDTNDSTAGIGYNENPADPENPGAVTHSGTDSTSYSWCAAMLALRPAPAIVPSAIPAPNIRHRLLRGVGRQFDPRRAWFNRFPNLTPRVF